MKTKINPHLKKHAGTRNLTLVVVSLILSMRGVCQLPVSDASISSGRIVSRGFINVDSLKDNSTLSAGFVQYVEVTSVSVPLNQDILKQLLIAYKAGHLANGPLTPPVKAAVLFDAQRKPQMLLWIFDDNRIAMSSLFEVDGNCYQGVRNDPLGCTIQDAVLSQWLRDFVKKSEKLPVDIEPWKNHKK